MTHASQTGWWTGWTWTLGLALAAPVGAATPVTRTPTQVSEPEVNLRDHEGRTVAWPPWRNPDQPALVQFVFTSCRAICPVLATSFAQLQQDLGPAGEQASMASVSLDPEHDTPSVGKAWLQRFGARGRWQFLTGDVAQVRQLAQAFDAWPDDKNRHGPLTFLWSPRERAWIRLTGFVPRARLLAEWQAARQP